MIIVLACADCPVLFEQVIVYDCVDAGATTAEPDVGSLPENPAPVIAVHDVALVEFQMIVVELP